MIKFQQLFEAMTASQGQNVSKQIKEKEYQHLVVFWTKNQDNEAAKAQRLADYKKLK